MSNPSQARIRQAFGRAAASYDRVAELQLATLRSMVKELGAQGLLEPESIWLDLGSGTGSAQMELGRIQPLLSMVSLDLSHEMLQFQQQRFAGSSLRPLFIHADALRIPLGSDTLDGVFSNMMLQWCDDPLTVLEECYRVLRHSGQLMFSTFGPQTLCELATAWQSVDQFRHVNTFVSLEEIHYFAERAGFAAIDVSRNLVRESYASVETLMRSLKDLGAHTVTGNHRAGYLLTPSRLSRLRRAYEAQMDHDGQIYATYEIIMLKAAKTTG